MKKPFANNSVIIPHKYSTHLDGNRLFPKATLALAFASSLVCSSMAANFAPLGTGIIGLKQAVDGGPETETPFANSGSPAHVNDDNITTRVDTYNGGGSQTASYVGVLWDEPLTTPVSNLDLTFALFSNGGWFGANQIGPAAGGTLTDEHLIEPRIEITTNGGETWTVVESHSNYYTAMRGRGIGGGANPNPNTATANFTLAQPAQNINGIRIVGLEGGTVSGGFLGVFELAVRDAGADTDGDGMEDAWETIYDLSVGTNDSAADADSDGLTNLKEYTGRTNPKVADTDGDGLNDGAEVNSHLTHPQRADTDGDGLNDGHELNTLHTNPLSKDSDGDGFPDGLEVNLGTDPTNSQNYPTNIAISGTGIIGKKDALDGGPETEQPHANSGAPSNINDGNLTSKVDTYGVTKPVSYVGVVWDQPITRPIAFLDLTLALFSNGGWFGVNGIDPGAGGALTSEHLVEPRIEVTTDGTTWTTVAHTSDYLTALNGQGIGGGGNPNPNTATATFTLTQPAQNIKGIRLVGTDGGTAANGFLGVYELTTRTPVADSDNDGMDDAWERLNGLTVGTNDATGDADSDGLTNLAEFTAKTNPQAVDSDGDGLNDGPEVNTHQTNPLRTDTDSDGLSDSAEINTHHTNPLVKDTDGDGFSDVAEVTEGSDPTVATSVPINLALIGTGIIGKKDDIDGGIEGEFPHANSGTAANVNDGNLNSRVDTYGRSLPVSYVGVLWSQPITKPIVDLKLTLALFSNGGWFGVNNTDPGAGGLLTAEHLVEPRVEVTTDGGQTWTIAPHTSDYIAALTGVGIGGGAYPNPNRATATFVLNQPAANINGIRLVQTDGGTALGGFLGVFELAARTAAADSDNDGMEDAWETANGLNVGVNDSAADADSDGLTNLKEFTSKTNPQVADSDADGLNDGAEVNTHLTNPLRIDTDGDGLNDGPEINTHQTNPLVKDTDSDGFSDLLEVTDGSNPNSASSVPNNIASLGVGIIGVKETFEGGPETELPVANAGGVAAINDGNLNTRVDTYGGPPALSFVGIVWEQPVAKPIVNVEVTHALFSNGGWFGVNGIDPGPGGLLTTEHLIEPRVEVTTDGTTWTQVNHTSDYIANLKGVGIGGGAFPNPNRAKATFTLAQPAQNIRGIRLIGSDGGSVGAGFLGVFELEANTAGSGPQAVRLINIANVAGQINFEFDSQAGVTHTVQYKNAVTDANWQTLTTITGDGTRKLATDNAGGAQRIYRVSSQ